MVDVIRLGVQVFTTIGDGIGSKETLGLINEFEQLELALISSVRLCERCFSRLFALHDYCTGLLHALHCHTAYSTALRFDYGS
jgi:hypothetical protein